MRIGLGGGCHWCTEAVFQALRGVERVEQGYIRSVPPDQAWSEAVIVHFDPQILSIDVLIDVHLRTHSSTGEHTMRPRYRSAVYVFDADQCLQVRDVLERLQQNFQAKLVTRVLRFDDFRPSESRYQNYHRNHQAAPFCERFIDPKLALIRRLFARHAVPVTK